MSSNFISIIGTIVQAYASIVGIIGMFLVYIIQRKDEKMNRLKSLFSVQTDSLLVFINDELEPAYSEELVIRTDRHNYDEVIESIEEYLRIRRENIPDLDMTNIKIFIVLWGIVEKEFNSLKTVREEIISSSTQPVLPKLTTYFFIGYYLFELCLGFIGLYLASNEYVNMVLITNIILFLAIIGLVPLCILLINLIKIP